MVRDGGWVDPYPADLQAQKGQGSEGPLQPARHVEAPGSVLPLPLLSAGNTDGDVVSALWIVRKIQLSQKKNDGEPWG